MSQIPQNPQKTIIVDTRPGAEGNQFQNLSRVTGIITNQNNVLVTENQSLRTVLGHVTKVVTLLTEKTIKNSEEIQKSKETLPKKKKTRRGGLSRTKIRKAKGEKRAVTKLATHGQIDIGLCQKFLQGQNQLIDQLQSAYDSKKGQREGNAIVPHVLQGETHVKLKEKQAKEFRRIQQIADHKEEISEQQRSIPFGLLDSVDLEVIRRYRTEAWVFNRHYSAQDFKKARARLLIQEIHKVKDYTPAEKDNWIVWARQHKYISAEQCEYQRKKLIRNLGADIKKCRRELDQLEFEAKVI